MAVRMFIKVWFIVVKLGNNLNIDAKNSASVHQCQIKSRRQSFGRSRKE